jgi:hypothetical protein
VTPKDHISHLRPSYPSGNTSLSIYGAMKWYVPSLPRSLWPGCSNLTALPKSMSLTFSWPSSMIFCGLKSLWTTREVCTELSDIYDMRLLLRVVQMLSWWVTLCLGVYWWWIFRSLKTSSLFLHSPRILELNNTTSTQIYLLLLLVLDDLLELCNIGMV